MSEVFSQRDKYGHYSIHIDDRILVVTVGGALGKGLTNKYSQDLRTAIEYIKDKPWAYLADAMELEALTNDGLQYLTEAFKYSMQNNCVVGAYCMTSSLAIHQADSVRRQYGAEGTIEQRLFDDVTSAKAFLNQHLEQ
ncbi:hypothetical protein [Neptunicella sp.]|uniref:hypothetical protein n=1 Tax=Neptunicella sp. TaxID=2125986 RepID=UPI003F69324B